MKTVQPWIRPCYYVFALVSFQFSHGQESITSENRLAGDEYVATSNIFYQSQFAQDVSDMRQALSARNYDLVKKIYENGEHVFALDEAGNPDLELKKSLQSLSLEETQFMTSEITFNLYINAFQKLIDGNGLFDERPVEEYGDAIVNDLFDLGPTHYGRAIDAAIIHNLWMATAHVLNLAAQTCQKAYDTGDVKESETAAEFIDLAAAYYIGSGVNPDENLSGHLLYGFAEAMAPRFDQDEGQAHVNKKMIDHLNAAKTNSILCATGEDTPGHIRIMKDEMISIMTIPLVQSLIHAIETQDSLQAELYTVAIIPQISACSPSTFQFFIDNFVSNSYDIAMKSTALLKLKSMYDCLGITCDDVGKYVGGSKEIIECDNTASSYAGYKILSPNKFIVHEASKMDIDIAQLEVLLSLGANEAASDLFFNGRNSYAKRGSNLLKLSDFLYNTLDAYANDPRNVLIDQFQAYSNFFGQDQYVQYDMVEMFKDTGEYSKMPNEARSIIGSGMMQTMTMYMKSLTYMDVAEVKCDTKDFSQGMETWDLAAVSVIGSMEGTDPKGNAADEGFFMFRLIKQMCLEFQTCYYIDSNDERSISTILAKAERGFATNSCDLISEATDKITSIFQAAFIQSAIHYTSILATSNNQTWKNVSNWYVSMLSITPLINQINPDLALQLYDGVRTVHSENFQPSDGNYDLELLKQVLQETVPQMKQLDCNDIGTKDGFENICQTQATTPSPTETVTASPTIKVTLAPTPLPTQPFIPVSDETVAPSIEVTTASILIPETTIAPTPMVTAAPTTSLEDSQSPSMNVNEIEDLTDNQIDDSNNDNLLLIDEIYEISTDVSQMMKLALDVRDIKSVTTIDEASNIYENGKYALDASNLNTIITLKRLSTEMTSEMVNEWTYNIYRNAYDGLTDENGKFDGSVLEQYGDAVVRDLFNLDEKLVAAEAVVVVNVWMAVTHYLEVAAAGCKDSNEAGIDIAINALDKAVAFWVGERDIEGAPGYLMYAMSERMSDLFGTSTNDDILDLMNNAKEDYLLGGRCSTDSTASQRFRGIKDEIISKMTIPLVQNFINHIVEGSNQFVELYSLVVGPLISACSRSTFEFFMDNAVYDDYDVAKNERFIEYLQYSYSCLGITCEDVGEYNKASIPICTDVTETSQLAGYDASTNIQLPSRIDLDILQISMFMEIGATEAARDIYYNGRNSLKCVGHCGYNSLYDFTQVDDTIVGDQFETYKLYYGQPDYSSVVLLEEIDIAEEGGSFEFGSSVVSGVAQFMIMYMYPLQLMYTSLEFCTKADDMNAFNIEASEKWDLAAASLIGSIEGNISGINEEDKGTLLYSSIKQTCRTFNTCYHNDPNDPNSLIYKLNQGRGHAFDASCSLLEVQIESIISVLQATLIQSTIYYALVLDNTNSDRVEDYSDDYYYDTDISLRYAAGSAKVSAMSVIPLVHVSDASTTTKLMKMIESPQTVNASVIINGFKASAPIMIGLNCDDIGVLNDAGGFCLDKPTNIDNTINDQNSQPPQIDIDNLDNEPDIEIDRFSSFPFNRYPKNNAAWDFAKIAKDIEEMKNPALETDEAYEIYEKGKMSSLSFKSMIVDSVDDMLDDPVFNIYLHALEDESQAPDPLETFPDGITSNAFETSKELGIESAVVLNLWMYIVHLLEKVLSSCEMDSSVTIDLLDRALYLWIGEDQREGSTSGYLMYSIAEYAEAELLGNLIDPTQAEVYTNVMIIALFNDARDVISTDNYCSTEDHSRLRQILSSIQSKMSIPLIQKLIYHMHNGNKSYIKLYAFSIVPLIESCNPGSFLVLKKILLDKDFDLIDLDFALHTLESAFNCLGMTCDEVGTFHESENLEYTCDDRNIAMAGFSPSKDSREQAKIDLDILQIKMFMGMQAYATARDVYFNGRNSYDFDEEAIVSLYKLTKSIEGGEVLHSTLDTILSDRDSTFLNLTNEQRVELVGSTLQTVVSIQTVSIRLDKVGDLCVNSEFYESRNILDRAAAYIIGSLEGPLRGGSPSSSGLLIYALAKEMCNNFGTCAGSGDALVNENLVRLLQDTSDNVENIETCEKVIENIGEIKKALLIPIIQAILHYSWTLDEAKLSGTPDRTTDASKLYSLSTAILPFISTSENKDMIETNLIKPLVDGTPTIPDGPTAIFTVFQEEIINIGIDCDDIGLHTFGSLCPIVDEGDNIDTTEPTSLSNGLYITTTNVGDRHKIDNDIKEMGEALDSGDVELARQIYNHGLGAWKYDENGTRLSEKFSLKEFSVETTKEMNEDPVYNIFLYALQDVSGNFMGVSVNSYADTFVNKAFNEGTLARDAAVALNLWMLIVHKLYQAVRDCKSNMEDSNYDAGGVHSLDEAVAFWIGESQMTGDAYSGHLLYALTEDMGARFNQDKNGQALVNKKILTLFNEAKDQITFSNACTLNSNSNEKLKHIADSMVSVMVIPLLQSLIHYMYKDDRSRVQLYATAVVPMIAGCNSVTYARLQNLLIDNEFKPSTFDEVIYMLQGSYSCLGITCADVGVYTGDELPSCNDPEQLSPIFGYIPSTDVREYAKLDLDSLQLRILMEMEAYEAAQDLYLMGKNSRISDQKWQSFHYIATNHFREIVPQYMVFQRYFEDYDYADTIISKTLAGQTPYDVASASQKTAIVLDTIQSMVGYMYVASLIYEALDDCKQGSSTNDDINRWDAAVASFFGSTIGPEDVETQVNSGEFLFKLGQDRCEQFGTCDGQGFAIVNKEILMLLFAGQSELNLGNCEAMENTAEKILPLLQVSLVQSTLKYAIDLEGKELNTKDASKGSGFAFSSSILPLVNDVDGPAASVIERNMNFEFINRPVYQGALSIFESFQDAVPKMIGFNCEMVGKLDDMNVCGRPFTITAERKTNKYRRPLTIGFVVAGNIIFIIIAFKIGYNWNQRKRYGIESSRNIEESATVTDKDTESLGTESMETINMKGKTEVLNTMGVVD